VEVCIFGVGFFSLTAILAGLATLAFLFPLSSHRSVACALLWRSLAHAIQPCASNSTKHSTANAVSVNLNIQCRLFGGCKHVAASKRPGRRGETGIL